MEGGFGCPSYHVERRLARLAAANETRGVDYLVGIIREGSWHSGRSAAPGFAGLRGQKSSAEEGLVGLLKQGTVDSQRHAIEALGFLGGDGWAFAIAEFAQYRQWIVQNPGFQGPDKYYLGKFYHFAIQALIRMTALLTVADDIERCLQASKDLLAVCENVLGKARVSTWDIRHVQHHFPPRAADPIIQTWIRGDSPLLQECGVDALGHIRLNRTLDFLLDVLENRAFSDTMRQSAGISISQFASGVAAAQLAKRLDQLERGAGGVMGIRGALCS